MSNYYMDITCSVHQTLGAADRQSEFEILYYYMRNCCKLIASEQWYLTLKGHSQLKDRADLDANFASLKSDYLNPKSNLSCLVFDSILDLLLKTSF